MNAMRAPQLDDGNEKLSRMESEKFYFVSTIEMANRAETKIRKANWSMRVIVV